MQPRGRNNISRFAERATFADDWANRLLPRSGRFKSDSRNSSDDERNFVRVNDICVAHARFILLTTGMTNRLRPTLNVTVDAHIKSELERRKKHESLNVSAFVNAALLPHFPVKKIKPRTKK